MKITFVRHTAVAVDKTLCYGKTDVALAETFGEEMALIRQRIGNQTHDAVFSSPLTRCRQLASALIARPAIVLDERLLELDFGDWELVAWDAIFASSTGKTWFEDYVNVRCPNGEAFTDQLARMASFLDSVRALGHRHVLAFTHAGCIRAALCLLDKKSPDEAFTTPLDYGQIITFSLDNHDPEN